MAAQLEIQRHGVARSDADDRLRDPDTVNDKGFGHKKAPFGLRRTRWSGLDIGTAEPVGGKGTLRLTVDLIFGKLVVARPPSFPVIVPDTTQPAASAGFVLLRVGVPR